MKPITIIGGGLAGLTLGIGLRQRGIPVTIWEAGNYPRHRVCGEFISGNGIAVLRRLGLHQRFENAGAIQVRTARFLAGKNQSPVRELPPALGFSRYEMDRLLAEEFQKLGGELQTGERREASEREDGLVRASGRKPQSTDAGWRWFGVKIHARNIELTADLEMHILQNSYVGVNRINNGEVNVCGLFRARHGESPANAKSELLRGAPDSTLRQRLAKAEFDESSFCSVAGLSLRPQRAALKDEFCIGDALTMIPPATGNGMSMAFESAAIALDPLADYSRGKLNWPDAKATAAQLCDAAFAQRLRWARFLQSLMFSPWSRGRAGSLLLRSETVWNWMFSRTR